MCVWTWYTGSEGFVHSSFIAQKSLAMSPRPSGEGRVPILQGEGSKPVYLVQKHVVGYVDIMI